MGFVAAWTIIASSSEPNYVPNIPVKKMEWVNAARDGEIREVWFCLKRHKWVRRIRRV